MLQFNFSVQSVAILRIILIVLHLPITERRSGVVKSVALMIQKHQDIGLSMSVRASLIFLVSPPQHSSVFSTIPQSSLVFLIRTDVSTSRGDFLAVPGIPEHFLVFLLIPSIT